MAALAQRGAGQSRQLSYLPIGLGVAAGLGSLALCQVWSISLTNSLFWKASI